MNQLISILKAITPSVTARATIRSQYQVTLHLFTESGVDDGAYYPPMDIEIYGQDGLKILRDLCDETLKEFEKQNKPNDK